MSKTMIDVNLHDDAPRKNEEWLSAILEVSRDGLLIEDDELIVYVNKAYAHLFGYELPGELIGQHVSLVLSPQDNERMLEFGRSRLRGEATTPSIYEFKGKRKDGHLIDLEASVSTSVINGKAYITTAVRDIAERKQSERELRQARDELEKRVTERTIELARSNEGLQAEINERQRVEEGRRELLRQIVNAQEEERRRIARELHDQMGQHLTAIMLEVESLKHHFQAEPSCQKSLHQLDSLTNHLSKEIHTLALELRPTALDDVGFYSALRNYVEEWAARYRLSVDLHIKGTDDARLPPHIETTLYRIAQEALTNIVRHAESDHVSLIVEQRSDHVMAIIEDDGQGFDVESTFKPSVNSRRIGLLGMRERATLVGGSLNIESTPGGGTTVFVSLPIPQHTRRSQG